MADTEQDIFEQALNDVQPEPKGEGEAVVEKPKEPVAEGEQPRDEHGRFVPKATATEEPKAEEQPKEPEKPEAEPAKEPQQDHRVPLSEHLSEREKRQAAERERDEERRQRESDRRELQALQRQIEELKQPKQEPPDVWANPQGYVDSRIAPIQKTAQEQQDAMFDRVSRIMAVQQFGKETVDAAYAALEAEVRLNPAARYEAQRIWQSEFPHGELVAWHKRQTTLSEIGEDPAAYRQRLRDELLKDPAFQAEAIAAAKAAAGQTNGNGTRPQSVTRLPPSLNQATGQGGAAVTTEPLTDAGLHAELFTP